MMDTVKNVAAIIGVILSFFTLCGVLVKPFRAWIASLFVRYGHTDEVARSIAEVNSAIADIKTMLDNHMADYESFRQEDECENMVLQKFIKTYCRRETTKIFYTYLGTKVLPLYERNNLNTIKELYIDTLHCNSYASTLLDEMDKWQVDYTKAVPDDGNDGGSSN